MQTGLTPVYELVVLVASLGGIAALDAVLSGLPADFPLPIVALQHLPEDGCSKLADILGRRSRLPVEWAKAGARPARGKVHLAPPGAHLSLTAERRFALDASPRVNFCRPSGDVLLRSVADCYGAAAVGAVLTGKGMDGARGLAALKRRGGFAIAQSEATSEAFEMPRAAIDIAQADLILDLGKIAPALVVLAGGGGADAAVTQAWTPPEGGTLPSGGAGSACVRRSTARSLDAGGLFAPQRRRA